MVPGVPPARTVTAERPLLRIFVRAFRTEQEGPGAERDLHRARLAGGQRHAEDALGLVADRRHLDVVAPRCDRKRNSPLELASALAARAPPVINCTSAATSSCPVSSITRPVIAPVCPVSGVASNIAAPHASGTEPIFVRLIEGLACWGVRSPEDGDACEANDRRMPQPEVSVC
jgi:hypothetical protein